MTISAALQQVDRTWVIWRKSRLIYFGGCDYFRLSSRPEVLRAASEGLKKFGLNVAASRLTTGNHEIYDRLERDLADFFGVPSATLASNGYNPNLMVAQALAGQYSHAIIDERAHVSLVDAVPWLACPTLSFKHRSPKDLARVLKRLGKCRPILLTDGMFSRDGSIAPLREYLAQLPKSAALLVDDAHGAGILGKSGRGTPEAAGIAPGQVIQTITLSKAFGVYGGAVLGKRELRKTIIERSHIFAGNTPLPLPLANAALKAVSIMKRGRKLRERLAANSSHVKSQLAARGFVLPDNPGPIVPWIPPNPRSAVRLRNSLLAAGIFPSFIKYPGGPRNGYFRFVISSEHTETQLAALVQALAGK